MGDRTGQGSSNNKKRKWDNSRIQHGSRNKKGDLGRKDFNRQSRDRRAQNTDEANKRRRTDDADRAPALPKPFPEEEVAAEERRPKHKVAVMIGYSGTGYKGMQINTHEKTIEGDLFAAFITAGAISKANANDPKKSQLVRCARTDKGVHAAGNVISLKLIVEDEDVVQKINAALSPQIRVWGIQRTVGSFSAYQAVDSRWYEYLIPTHSFIPPHPSSWLAKKLEDIADEASDRGGYEGRQEEVASFWAETEEKYIKPILDDLPENVRQKVSEALYEAGVDPEEPAAGSAAAEESMVKDDDSVEASRMEQVIEASTDLKAEPAAEQELPSDQQSDGVVALTDVDQTKQMQSPAPNNNATTLGPSESEVLDVTNIDATTVKLDPRADNKDTISPATSKAPSHRTDPITLERRATDAATKSLRNAYRTAKRAYRIPPARLARIQPILDRFVGTRNFHNYTVQKTFRDPSAKRIIKSFRVNETPIVIDGTEWLSIKIHGQSFMMHQIRKMVGMVALLVRCGCDPTRIGDSFNESRVSIPKAPSLGLLLERPVFSSYNDGPAKKSNRPAIDFTQYEKEMDEFKQREIYERIYREENEENAFHQYFAHVDNFQEGQFLYLSSKGIGAVKEYEDNRGKGKAVQRLVESDDEGRGGEDDG